MRYGITPMTLRILSCRKILLSLLFSNFLLGDADTTDIDLDALWESTVWEEIDEIIEVEGEVEQVVSVAGVRGAEAEDEALEHLYYRKSMKKLSQVELQKALGRLLKKKSTVTDSLTLSKIEFAIVLPIKFALLKSVFNIWSDLLKSQVLTLPPVP